MPTGEPLDALPLWALFIAILLLILLSVEAGYRLGRYRVSRVEEKDAPVGEMVGATLGLLAFVLAFTFGLAAERYDNRREVVLDEANAIGTTYLRAGMLPERREEIRELLRHYVDVRLEVVRTGKIAEGIRRSEELHKQLWELTVPIAEKNPESHVVELFIHSLNEVIDLHAKRVMFSVRNRIPFVVWAALYGVAILSFVALGYHSGLTRTRRSLALIPVAFTFAVVLELIADLDRPLEGALEVSQQALIDVRHLMDEMK